MSNIRSTAGRPRQAASQTTKGRVQRLMQLRNLLGETKTVKHAKSPKSNVRTLSLKDGSLRVTTKQPELCRKAIVSSRSLKIVTPSNSISKTETTETNVNPKRTLRNDLYTSRLSNIVEEDLRTSSPDLSFTSLTEERPLLFRKSAARPVAQNTLSVSNFIIVYIDY